MLDKSKNVQEAAVSAVATVIDEAANAGNGKKFYF